jgi:hypothetical protein
MEARLRDRFDIIKASLQRNQTVIVNRIASNKSESVGIYRFLRNKNVKLEELIEDSCSSVNDLNIKHALVIQDSSEINFFDHNSGGIRAKDPNLGPMGSKWSSAGFFLHPGLVVNAANGLPLGFSSIKFYNRQFGDLSDKKSRNYQTLGIEEKESYKWLETGIEAANRMKGVDLITTVGDRENDIFEVYWRLPERVKFLARASENRKVNSEEKLLFEWLESLPISGEVVLKIENNPKRKSREALLHIRYGQVEIIAPNNGTKDKNRPQTITVNAVYVHEDPKTVPIGEEAIVWRLITNHIISDLEFAKTLILWYKWRWLIEELFRVLKSEGLKMEHSQLDDGLALKKMCSMALPIAQQALLLKKGRTNEHIVEQEIFVDEDDFELLEELNTELQGKTIAQQNPYSLRTLGGVAWVMGRLGGWKGYTKSEGPPGVISIFRGILEFKIQLEGWKKAKRRYNPPKNNHTNST